MIAMMMMITMMLMTMKIPLLKTMTPCRRSREARRLKENQIALRAAFLERENRDLKEQVDRAAR